MAVVPYNTTTGCEPTVSKLVRMAAVPYNTTTGHGPTVSKLARMAVVPYNTIQQLDMGLCIIIH